MRFDSDIVLIGTGIAPLIAARIFLSQSKSVLVLNPDRDFFLESSELSLDPLLDVSCVVPRLKSSSASGALQVLGPPFPGSLEFWDGKKTPSVGFHDPAAPYIRQRDRLWMASRTENRASDWENLEHLYVEAADGHFHPQLLEGYAAISRFPGAGTYWSSERDLCRGLLIPHICDVDVTRYQQGLLEFVRERLGPEGVMSHSHPIEWVPNGVKFSFQGAPQTARVREKVFIFWTPHLTHRFFNDPQKLPRLSDLPRGIRLWEEWEVQAKGLFNPNTIGIFGNHVIWPRGEGSPDVQVPLNQFSVLRKGPLVGWNDPGSFQTAPRWISTDSLRGLSRLFHDFLKWDRFSVRGLKTHSILEWAPDVAVFSEFQTRLPVCVVPQCDGPLVDVVQAVSAACLADLGISLPHQGQS